MKKLFNLFLFVVTSLLLLSCEKEPEYPGAYPFDHVVFYGDTLITEGDSARVLFLDYNNWNQDLYPMQLWVDNEEIATISSSVYLTAKKEGIVTIHAKVMSIYGEIESRIHYTVRDFLKEYIKKVLQIGIPSAFEQVLYQTCQIVFLYYVTYIGATSLAARQYAVNISMFTYLFAIAIGMGTAILIGRQGGAGEQDIAS